MIKQPPRKIGVAKWAVPVAAASIVVASLEIAQRLNLWAGIGLAAVFIIGGIAVLAFGRGRE